MKKKINKKKVPAYAFGIDQGLEIASILGAGLQGFTEEGSGADIAGSTLGGAAKGASVGSAILPGIGTAIGGAVGGVGNLVSSIFRKNAINKQKRIKANAKEVAMGKGNAATLEQEYWNDNSLAYTFENGGILPDLAYVDNNEVIRDDFGNIAQVPNSKPGTDNHLIDASNLESVLSDRIKRPGTNRTFAQEGEKLTKMTKKSKGNDIFAKNTDMLNKRNANAMYEQLLTEQEAVKAKKGIKPKVKGIPAYADGKGDWTRRLGKSIANFLTSPVQGTAVNSALTNAFNNTGNKAGLGATKNSNWDAPVMNYLNGINWTENLVPKSGLSPILYNWIQSRRRPEVEDQVINPYTGAINRAMASRKLNIEPTLAANRRSRAIARNNMARLNPNTGMNLAYGNQLATGEYAQNASVYANRDNANNQYLGEYANMMNNLGQQYVQNTVLTNDLNARNRAAARNFGATAAGQLGQWSQTKEKMRNEAARDAMIYPYLRNFLAYGNPGELIADMDNMYYNNRKGKKNG